MLSENWQKTGSIGTALDVVTTRAVTATMTTAVIGTGATANVPALVLIRVADAARSQRNLLRRMRPNSASGAVGTVTLAERGAALTGNQATGRVGSFGVFYWSLIDDNSVTNWALIDDNNATNWQNIETNQNPEWDLILTE